MTRAFWVTSYYCFSCQQHLCSKSMICSSAVYSCVCTCVVLQMHACAVSYMLCTCVRTVTLNMYTCMDFHKYSNNRHRKDNVCLSAYTNAYTHTSMHAFASDPWELSIFVQHGTDVYAHTYMNAQTLNLCVCTLSKEVESQTDSLCTYVSLLHAHTHTHSMHICILAACTHTHFATWAYRKVVTCLNAFHAWSHALISVFMTCA
jgi:hypothetical protein